MLIMIVHSSGSLIPYNVISDIIAMREVEGSHIPLPAKSNRERTEMIQRFIQKAGEHPGQTWLLVVNEELNDELKLDGNSNIDSILSCFQEGNNRPIASVGKNGIGDEGVTYEEFLQDLQHYEAILPKPVAVQKPKYFSRGAA